MTAPTIVAPPADQLTLPFVVDMDRCRRGRPMAAMPDHALLPLSADRQLTKGERQVLEQALIKAAALRLDAEFGRVLQQKLADLEINACDQSYRLLVALRDIVSDPRLTAEDAANIERVRRTLVEDGIGHQLRATELGADLLLQAAGRSIVASGQGGMLSRLQGWLSR